LVVSLSRSRLQERWRPGGRPEIGATVLKLSNVEVWLKPTDFKNDQIVFSVRAWGHLARSEQNFMSASLATAMVGVASAA
jgi:hypothetical protein